MSADVETANDGPAWPAPVQDAILVWPFHAAPEPLRGMSEHGGDEVWIVYVPAGMVKGEFKYPRDPPWWVQNLACYRVDVHTLADGALVYIGAHA